MKKYLYGIGISIYLSSLLSGSEVLEGNLDVNFKTLKSNQKSSNQLENKIIPNITETKKLENNLNNDKNLNENINNKSNEKELLMIDKKTINNFESKINFLSEELSKAKNQLNEKDKKLNELENTIIEVNKYLKYLGSEVNKNREKINMNSKIIEKLQIQNSPLLQDYQKIKEIEVPNNFEEIKKEKSKIEKSEEINTSNIIKINDNSIMMETNTGVYMRNSNNDIIKKLPFKSKIIVDKERTILYINGKNLVKYKIQFYFSEKENQWINVNKENYYIFYKYANKINKF